MLLMLMEFLTGAAISNKKYYKGDGKGQRVIPTIKTGDGCAGGGHIL
jgi:hypothetical protein